MSDISKLTKFLDQNLFVTLDEAKKLGINPMMLSRMTAREELFRVQHGVYAKELDWLTDPLKKYTLVCALYSKAIVSGISALTYYGLTDAEERQIWISIPPPQTLHNPRYRVIRPTGIAYSLGVLKYPFGQRMVRIYDLEKTLVDAFKYGTEEVAFKALKGYLKRKEKDVQKLIDYARRLKKPLDNLITLLQADE